MTHSVLCWINDEAAVAIVTGFTSQEEASDWGRAWEATHDGSPCWNTLSSYPTVTVLPASTDPAQVLA